MQNRNVRPLNSSEVCVSAHAALRMSLPSSVTIIRASQFHLSIHQKRWRHVDFTRMHCGYQVRIPEKRWQEAKLMDWNFNTSVKITYCLLFVLQKTLIWLFKQFQTAMHTGKIDNRHLFATVNCIFCPIRTLNWLVAASKLHKNRAPRRTAKWPYYCPFSILFILCLSILTPKTCSF